MVARGSWISKAVASSLLFGLVGLACSPGASGGEPARAMRRIAPRSDVEPTSCGEFQPTYAACGNDLEVCLEPCERRGLLGGCMAVVGVNGPASLQKRAMERLERACRDDRTCGCYALALALSATRRPPSLRRAVRLYITGCKEGVVDSCDALKLWDDLCRDRHWDEGCEELVRWGFMLARSGTAPQLSRACSRSGRACSTSGG